MKKGYSVVITTSDSGNSRYFFISKIWLRTILLLVVIMVIFVVVTVANYSRIYYQALETVILKRRNAEIEEEFAKLQEIRKNLEIAETNNEQIRIMLGIEKTPSPVTPVINEVDQNYFSKINTTTVKEEIIPSLLPTIGRLSKGFDLEHRGIDIAAPRFSPVVAAASGFTAATGWDSIYGNYIIVEHDANYSTFYGHLNSIAVKKDDKVRGGKIIGTIGSTGRSTSPHLHYEVRFQHNPVDPLGYVPFLFNLKK